MFKRRFVPGEEWLYIKVYTGPTMQENLLIREFHELIDVFYKDNLIAAFFFVRYSDELGAHLRLRFKLIADADFNKIFLLFNEKIRSYVDKRIISRIIYDTYNREVERYLECNLEDIEIVFSINSQLIMNGLRLMHNKEIPDDRWVWGVKIMDNLLNTFGLTLEEKGNLYEDYYKVYEKEFGSQRINKKKLGDKYRVVRSSIEKILLEENLNPFYSDEQESLLTNKLDNAVKRILDRSKILNITDVVISNLLKSIMHMHYNRLFKSQQRMNELVIYFIMSKIYKTLVFMEESRRRLFDIV
jgi:thiopeptide-type bacteriocin biosynthesis protein